MIPKDRIEEIQEEVEVFRTHRFPVKVWHETIGRKRRLVCRKRRRPPGEALRKVLLPSELIIVDAFKDNHEKQLNFSEAFDELAMLILTDQIDRYMETNKVIDEIHGEYVEDWQQDLPPMDFDKEL